MVKAVTKTTGSSHVFGALPKHMRRRAMSHNTKRLPARLREGAQQSRWGKPRHAFTERTVQVSNRSSTLMPEQAFPRQPLNVAERPGVRYEFKVLEACRGGIVQYPGHVQYDSQDRSERWLVCVRLHLLEKSQRASQKEKKEQSKSKSRKARRRHGNLLLEFNRRQRKNVWLETHIWHAKRFHMVKRWGYCLGDRPTYKCYRACYRAMSHYCLLQDLSYYCCVELQGPEEVLLRALSRLTSSETGPTFAAGLCLSGRRQGSAVLYRADQYPRQTLGPALFLWRPTFEGSAHRQLWLWIHPSLKQDLLPELQTVCQCSEAVVQPTPVPRPAPTPDPAPDPAPGPMVRADRAQPPGRKRKRKRDEEGSGGDTVPAKKILGDGTRSPLTPVAWSSASTGIVIRDLTMEIMRYRLIGPQSHSVLTDALTPASDCEAASKSETSCFWWPEHCKEEGNMSLHREQADVFHLLKGLCSTGEVPGGSVLGLTVDDPRLNLPGKRIKVAPVIQPQGEGEDEGRRRELMVQGIPAQCSQSALWDQAVRDNVTHNKISEQELNRMQSELLVPGSRLRPTPPQSRVPVLLVQQPGKQVGQEMGSWGAGWDLLLPKGWGMAFWVPLVYRGVRIGGLQEALKHSQNKGASHFPHDFPDCPASSRFLEEQEAQLLDKFKRRPPAKRPNYIKHGSLAPFRCPWQQLAEEWEMILREGAEGDLPVPQEVTSHPDSTTPPPSRVTVLRSRKAVRTVSAWCRPTCSRGQRWRRPVRATQPEQLSPATAAALCRAHPRSLVWARMSLLKKGRPTLHAMICIPTPEDIEMLRQDPACCGPQEPRHRDHFKSRAKRRTKGHKPAGSAHEPAEPGSASTHEPADVTSHCSRVTLGWVTQGDFTLSAGCGEALGYVSLSGLLHALSGQPADLRGLVLLRNPASLQYRFAKVTIEV
ncbi:hypothetical protein AAFF_G00044030 [Aldrovandia affinis]|uniref:Uncharacterized protein n=1 Tax=Aldrovandia affinis TaxID=143900 RepID=A0AAD7S246_9TELE|nr:hypothetical protein AAFF_G00044030 [Aldrovandia affinis]